MMEWSEMLPEVLDIIAQKYITCYEDYPSFAGVCKSWRLAAARTYHNSNGPPSRLPSLILAEKSDDHESRELFLFSNNSIRKIRLPEAYGKSCMSSCGWLLTVGKDFASQLINPLSREIINLPKVDTLPEFIDHFDLDEDDSHVAISRVVLSMESNMVIVIYGNSEKLGFCHIGDNKWTSVEQPFYNNSILDITFYNGQVYTFDWYKIKACNINGKDPAVLVDVTTMPEDDYELYLSYSVYIVGLDDRERKQLLVIYRVSNACKTKSFKVLAYDLESGKWSEVKDFGKKTLFVGLTSSFWVEDTTGVIKGNCIYYRDMDDEWRGENEFSEKGGRRYTGIYHLSNGTIEPHITGVNSPFKPRMKVLWLQSM